jgi:hypothetical protein
MAKTHLQATAFLFFAFYESHSYGVSILTSLKAGSILNICFNKFSTISHSEIIFAKNLLHVFFFRILDLCGELSGCISGPGSIPGATKFS